MSSDDCTRTLIKNLEKSEWLFTRAQQALIDYPRSMSSTDPMRQEMLREVSLYAEFVHPDVLLMLRTVINVTQWCKSASDLHTTVVSTELLKECEKTKGLVDKTLLKYTAILTQLERKLAAQAAPKVSNDSNALERTGSMTTPKRRNSFSKRVLLLLRRKPTPIVPESAITNQIQTTSVWNPTAVNASVEQQVYASIDAFRELTACMKPFVEDITSQLLQRQKSGVVAQQNGTRTYETVVRNGDVIIKSCTVLLATWTNMDSRAIQRMHIPDDREREQYLTTLSMGSNNIVEVRSIDSD